MSVRSFPTSLILALLAVVLFARPAQTIAGSPSVADLSVDKSGPAQSAADTDVSYTVTVTNLGPDDAASVVLDDPIPAGMTFVSAGQGSGPAFVCSTPPVGGTGSVNCTGAALPAGASASFTFVFHIAPATPPGTTFVNIATASSATFDPNSENDSGIAVTSTPPPAQADMGVSKTGPAKAGPDTDVVYTLNVTNGGPGAASTVTLNDPLPATMTFVSLAQAGTPLICGTPSVGSGGTVSCTAASYPFGGSTTLTLTVHVPPGTASGTFFQNTATVAAATTDPNGENDADSTGLVVSNADLSVTKAGPATVTAGTNVTYTLTFSNAGPDAATNAQLIDTLPPNTTFVSVAQNTGPAATCSAPPVGGTGTVSCDIPTFASGASATFTLVILAGNTSSITNTATAAADTFDPGPGNDASSATTAVTGGTGADLSVTKSGPPTGAAGGNLTYLVTVSNAGPGDASGVSLTDTLPAFTTFVSLNQSTGPAFICATPAVGGTGTMTCTIATFTNGSSATFNLVVAVSASAAGAISNTASVAAASSDPTPANNSSTSTAFLGQVSGIPTLSFPALAVLGLALGLAGVLLIRAQSFPSL